MDEEAFLRILRSDPENDAIRGAYWDWMEQQGDARATRVRLMRQRLQLLEQLEATDRLLSANPSGGDEAWLDLAFPLQVRSPIAGRCYLRPTPDAPAFVDVRHHVSPNTTVCLVEEMKLFQEVVAGHQGIVSEVVVANGDLVEKDQVLIRISRHSLDFW